MYKNTITTVLFSSWEKKIVWWILMGFLSDAINKDKIVLPERVTGPLNCNFWGFRFAETRITTTGEVRHIIFDQPLGEVI